MPEAKRAVNVYRCPHGHQTVTRDVAEGVTPFMIGCPTCKAAGTPPDERGFRSVMAQSSFYRVDQSLEHSHEWYRPESTAGLDPDTAEHVRNGGLLLREKAAPEAPPLLQHASKPRGPDQPFNACWIVRAPWAHLTWDAYAILLFDLSTEIPGKGPPHIYRSDVTHEVLVYALHPDHPLPILQDDGDADPKPHFLTPANHIYQFTAESDEAALRRINDIAESIRDQKLSPDTDYTPTWNVLFADGVSLKASAFMGGGQPVGHA